MSRARQALGAISARGRWRWVLALGLAAMVGGIVLATGGGEGDGGPDLAACFEQAEKLPEGDLRDEFLRLCDRGELERVDEEQLERERQQARERLEDLGGRTSPSQPADLTEVLERCRAEAPEEDSITREIILEECERAVSAAGGRR